MTTNWQREYIMEAYDLPFLRKGLNIKCGQDSGKIIGFINGKINEVLADFTTKTTGEKHG